MYEHVNVSQQTCVCHTCLSSCQLCCVGVSGRIAFAGSVVAVSLQCQLVCACCMCVMCVEHMSNEFSHVFGASFPLTLSLCLRPPGASSFNQPLGDWDVSSVTNMELMLAEAEVFNQPIGGWNGESYKSSAESKKKTKTKKSLTPHRDLFCWQCQALPTWHMCLSHAQFSTNRSGVSTARSYLLPVARF